jgi:ABC-type transport system involved in multi-copper enzyme maturation permease subunit
MKFLAILKDSLREAIDAKVFYVMVGLSVLVTLLAFTITFKPAPGGSDGIMQTSTLALLIDLPEEELRRGDPERLYYRMRQELDKVEARGEVYTYVSSQPAPGSEDGPSGTFLVVVRALYLDPKRLEAVQADPSIAAPFIKERFGKLGGLHMTEATEVRLLSKETKPGDLPAELWIQDPSRTDNKTQAPSLDFELTVKPTPVARRLWPHKMSLFFGALPLGEGSSALGGQVYFLVDWIIGSLGAAIATLVSIVLTAFFIPNMLRKGTIDLLIVKPIHRVTLLLYKFIGGMTFIFLNTTVAVGGVWLALSLRSGIWAFSFLLSIFLITFFFAILYAMSTLFAVLTKSPIVSILMACGFWAVLFSVGWLYTAVEANRRYVEQHNKEVALRRSIRQKREAAAAQRGENKDQTGNSSSGPRGRRGPGDDDTEETSWADNWFGKSVLFLHGILPQTRDLDMANTVLLMNDIIFDNRLKLTEHPIFRIEVSWTGPIIVSSLWIVLLVGLACWRFNYQDF